MALIENAYYCSCWKSFFPNEDMPDSDDAYFSAIINAGKDIEWQYLQFLHKPFKPLWAPFNECYTFMLEFFPLYSDMFHFKMNLAVFCAELHEDCSGIDHSKLQVISQHLDVMELTLKSINDDMRYNLDHLWDTDSYDTTVSQSEIMPKKDDKRQIIRMFRSEKELREN